VAIDLILDSVRQDLEHVQDDKQMIKRDQMVGYKGLPFCERSAYSDSFTTIVSKSKTLSYFSDNFSHIFQAIIR